MTLASSDLAASIPAASARVAATSVATLIVAPSGPALTPAQLARVAEALPSAQAPLWLAPGVAADVPFAPPAGADNLHWIEVARAALPGVPVDVVVQPAPGRRKKLLVADMDSTMIEQECIDELAEGLGLRAEVSAITERSMRGEIDFEGSLRRRVALLRGLEVAAATRIVVDRITPMPGGRVLVATMRAHGALTVIASGGFTIFTAHVAERLGFDRHHANALIVEDGRLAGSVAEPVFGRASKRDLLLRLRAERGLAPEETMAVGDGANDLAMLEEAGLGVAFRAKPAVAAAARARIEHGDLTALLYIQGYSLAEFSA